MQIEKDVIRKKITRTDHYYRVGDKVMVRRNQAYKYETSFQSPFEIVQMWTNITVTIRTVTVTARINICRIKPDQNTDLY